MNITVTGGIVLRNGSFADDTFIFLLSEYFSHHCPLESRQMIIKYENLCTIVGFTCAILRNPQCNLSVPLVCLTNRCSLNFLYKVRQVGETEMCYQEPWEVKHNNHHSH